MDEYELVPSERLPEELDTAEQHFLEVARSFGGIAVLDFFNTAELNGEGAVAGAGEDELQAIALRDGKQVHVQYSREMSFNLPYPRARELAVRVAAEEMKQRQAKKVNS